MSKMIGMYMTLYVPNTFLSDIRGFVSELWDLLEPRGQIGQVKNDWHAPFLCSIYVISNKSLDSFTIAPNIKHWKVPENESHPRHHNCPRPLDIGIYIRQRGRRRRTPSHDTELTWGATQKLGPIVRIFSDHWACLLYTSPSPRDA